MRIAIHQPNYLPWLGYFYKMAKSDIFVLLDNVQYEKNGYTNRCQIKTSQCQSWLTLPIKRRFPQMVNQAELVNYTQEKVRHLKTISLNYQRAKYFDYLFPELKTILGQDWQYLSNLNIKLIKFLKEKIGIKTKIKIASDYNISDKSTDLLISLCKKFNADAYLSGKGGQKYQDEKKFKQANIKLEITDFVHCQYSQLWDKFIPGLSIIDLLFNYGPKGYEFLQ